MRSTNSGRETIEIVKRSETARIFAPPNRNRRLTEDGEASSDHCLLWLHIAGVKLVMRRPAGTLTAQNAGFS